MAERPRRHRTVVGVVVAAVYAVSLAITHARREDDPHLTNVRGDERTVTVGVVAGDSVSAREGVRIAFWDEGPRDAPAVIMLHGSPGDNGAMLPAGVRVIERYRVIAPDLPGFGGSSRRVPDYSFRAHAHYVLQLMDSLEIDSAQVVGFSMGGGVLLSMYDLAPHRVRSAVLLASIGAQEYELLGDYYLNHAVHALQLAALWLLREGVPHFGKFDRQFLSVEYARNFFDSDQRPLRDVLLRFEPPVLILHGDNDPLVHPAAASEHHRLLPQSEMVMFDGGHFAAFMRPEIIAPPLVDFLDRVERGEGVARSAAPPDRVTAALAPIDPDSVQSAEGFTLVIVMLLIILSTFVLEDLACIGTGLMVARGTIGFWPGTVACIIGLYLGDLMLYLAGRVVGRRALRMIPFRWMIGERDVARSSAWFEERGLIFVFVSRFSPGTRLPTFFAAGMLRTNFWYFSLLFMGAILLWTPALVGLSTLFGGQVRDLFARWQVNAVWSVLITLALLLVVVKVIVPLFTLRGRRMVLSHWRRLTQWEFWPPWVFYIPVVAYVLGLALRYRSLSVFASANPGFDLGGFVGESKSEILGKVRAAEPGVVPAFRVLDGALSVERRLAEARALVESCGGGFPVVVKPDVGERGHCVSIVSSDAELEEVLSHLQGDVIVQEYAPGLEFGVFYYRLPSAERGHVFSITDKRFPSVTGDGVRSLESLILSDGRGVASARMLLRQHAESLATIPAAGEEYPLVQIGTHCRGSVFLDGSHLVTPELEAAVDRISRGVDGFTFGRYDIRVPSEDDLRAGKNLKVLELNGVTSEATHIYDPKFTLVRAYRTLFAQWRLAFRIGAEQRALGAQPPGVFALVRALFRRWGGQAATVTQSG